MELTVDRLTKQFKNKIAVDRVSLTLRPGVCGLLGANGAGKSTFFLCLNGVLTPDRGTMLLDGELIGKKERGRLCRRAGIVFQNADDQIIASTVAAEVSFGPMNLRLPEAEGACRVEHALDYMELQPFRARPPHELSGGEKKRVTIADILAMENDILLTSRVRRSIRRERSGWRLCWTACMRTAERWSFPHMIWISPTAGRTGSQCSVRAAFWRRAHRRRCFGIRA